MMLWNMKPLNLLLGWIRMDSGILREVGRENSQFIMHNAQFIMLESGILREVGGGVNKKGAGPRGSRSFSICIYLLPNISIICAEII